MTDDRKISEVDWKVWKALRLRCIDKFCHETFAQLQALIDKEEAVHDRHRILYQLVIERDQQIEVIFDPLKRSSALLQILNLYRLGLVTDQDVSLFGDELQQFLRDAKVL